MSLASLVPRGWPAPPPRHPVCSGWKPGPLAAAVGVQDGLPRGGGGKGSAVPAPSALSSGRQLLEGRQLGALQTVLLCPAKPGGAAGGLWTWPYDLF